MRACAVTVLLMKLNGFVALAHEPSSHDSPVAPKIPALKPSLTTVDLKPGSIIMTFGPIILPFPHGAI